MNTSFPRYNQDSCQGLCEQGDVMPSHQGLRRRERWHMKMHRMGGHRRGMGRGMGPRPLGHGDLRLLILSLIAEGPRHGYDLIQEIETRTAGTYKPSPGVMYPALEIIQDLGWAEVRAEGGKKTFHITADGRDELTREAAVIEAIHARLAGLLQANETADPADIRAAMHRLRHAVIVARGETSDAARHRRIVEILSAAKDEIAGLD